MVIPIFESVNTGARNGNNRVSYRYRSLIENHECHYIEKVIGLFHHMLRTDHQSIGISDINVSTYNIIQGRR